MSSASTNWRKLYPFESHYLDRGPLRYHYLDEGRGEPVVMVHGNPTWSFYFRELIMALRGGYRCIAPDHIGCGLSDKPGDDGYSYRLESRVDDLDALMEHLDLTENVTLVLHDWGGMIGMAWALRRPERIKRLIVMNTAAFLLPEVAAQRGHRPHSNCGTGVPPVASPDSKTVAPVSKTAAPDFKTVAPVSNRCGPPAKRLPLRLRLLHGGGLMASLAVRGLNLFSRAAVSMAVKKRLAPDVRAGLMAPYDSWKNRIATLRFVEDIPLSPAHPSYALVKSVDDNLGRLSDVPMLICWGEGDFVFDADFLDQWRRRFPKAEVHTFANAGHYVLEDAGEEIAELVRGFLSRP